MDGMSLKLIKKYADYIDRYYGWAIFERIATYLLDRAETF
jgi:hypothetical protein